MVVSRAEIGGHTVGSLHALYPGDDEPDAEQHGVVAYLASCIAHMYGDQSGLPVHGDGPVVAALADGLAVVDRDGHVRLWNPAAAQVTGRPADQALNRPLPFPLPPSGQVRDHRLPDGRWLRITSGELPGPGTLRVVTFRDITDQQRRDHDRELFVAVTSHELRTPVTVIKGYADTLTDHWESLDRRRPAAGRPGDRAARQRAGPAGRPAALLGHRGGAGRRPARSRSTSARRCGPRSPTCPPSCVGGSSCDLPADLPKALGDRPSLATVLTELATNAGKYSAAGLADRGRPPRSTGRRCRSGSATGASASARSTSSGRSTGSGRASRATAGATRAPGSASISSAGSLNSRMDGYPYVRGPAAVRSQRCGCRAVDRRRRDVKGRGRASAAAAMERAWCVVVPHHPAGARLARHRLADELADVVPPTLLADLVAVARRTGGQRGPARPTAARRGGAGGLAAAASADGPQIQLRVTDGGAGAGPRIRTASPDAVDGRGLHIVAGLASRWGVERDGLGQSVWAEFDPTGTTRPDLVAAG